MKTLQDISYKTHNVMYSFKTQVYLEIFHGVQSFVMSIISSVLSSFLLLYLQFKRRGFGDECEWNT